MALIPPGYLNAVVSLGTVEESFNHRGTGFPYTYPLPRSTLGWTSYRGFLVTNRHGSDGRWRTWGCSDGERDLVEVWRGDGWDGGGASVAAFMRRPPTSDGVLEGFGIPLKGTRVGDVVGESPKTDAPFSDG